MMTLEEISAHLEIRQALATYSRGVDRWDVDLLKQAYHAESMDNHTMFNGPGWEFAEFITDFCRKTGGVSQHHITNIYIELHGDSANVETYYIAYHQLNDEEAGTSKLLNTGGRYLDRFEKRNRQWKIAQRICTIDWSRENLPGQSWDGAQAFPAIGPRGVDPMYPLFEQTV